MKTYLITGASGGIGSAIARKIAGSEQEARIILHYNSNAAGADKLKAEIESDKISVFTMKADLESQKQIEKMIEKIKTEFGGVDVLVNNAGFVDDKSVDERSYADFEKTIKINLISNFYLSKELGKMMFEKKHGKILNISSTSGLILHSGSMCPTSIDYDAAKAGINALTKNFAKEFAPFVNVNAIAPGWVDTPLNDTLPKYVKVSEDSKILKNRWATPAEIAELAWFLISDKADYINGSIYEIDGGKK